MKNTRNKDTPKNQQTIVKKQNQRFMKIEENKQRKEKQKKMQK